MLGMVGKNPVAVKRVPIAIFQLIKENIKKLLKPHYYQEHLVRYMVSCFLTDIMNKPINNPLNR